LEADLPGINDATSNFLFYFLFDFIVQSKISQGARTKWTCFVLGFCSTWNSSLIGRATGSDVIRSAMKGALLIHQHRPCSLVVLCL
jgi:hypothetical protein